MASNSVRVRLLGVGVMGFGLFAWFIGERGGGVNTLTAAGAEKKGAPTKGFIGVAHCARCHTESQKDAPPVLCRCKEVPIWEKEDKHKDAYTVLLGTRAKQIGKTLGVKEVHKKEICLACHGVNDRAKDFKAGLAFKVEDGVSCVVCHGPYKDWVDKHGGVDLIEWRDKSRDEKEKDWGMTDLWNPAKRTKLCVSCHIGNAEDGKVVTHAMYAAGHPPLPSFEVATFSKQMPRHWEYLKEKTPQVQKLLKLSQEEARFEETKLVVVSGVVYLHEAMNLLVHQASANGHEPKGKPMWPELAQFECYACHHDLKRTSWRQERDKGGRPGRPRMRAWPTVLVKLGLRHLGENEKQLEKQVDALYQAFDDRPFGNPKSITSAARQIASWSDGLTHRLLQAKYDAPASHRLLHQLCLVPKGALPDYDSARQIAWAFQIIYDELCQDPKAVPANDQKIRAVLGTIDKELKLKLPSGKEVSIEKELQDGLEKIGNFNPYTFSKHLRALARLLPAT